MSVEPQDSTETFFVVQQIFLLFCNLQHAESNKQTFYWSSLWILCSSNQLQQKYISTWANREWISFDWFRHVLKRSHEWIFSYSLSQSHMWKMNIFNLSWQTSFFIRPQLSFACDKKIFLHKKSLGRTRLHHVLSEIMQWDELISPEHITIDLYQQTIDTNVHLQQQKPSVNEHFMWPMRMRRVQSLINITSSSNVSVQSTLTLTIKSSNPIWDFTLPPFDDFCELLICRWASSTRIPRHAH